MVHSCSKQSELQWILAQAYKSSGPKHCMLRGFFQLFMVLESVVVGTIFRSGLAGELRCRGFTHLLFFQLLMVVFTTITGVIFISGLTGVYVSLLWLLYQSNTQQWVFSPDLQLQRQLVTMAADGRHQLIFLCVSSINQSIKSFSLWHLNALQTELFKIWWWFLRLIVYQ